MQIVSRIAHFVAWMFAAFELAVLLSTCMGGFNEVRLGLTVICQVAFFLFLAVSTLADQSRVAVRTRLRNG